MTEATPAEVAAATAEHATAAPDAASPHADLVGGAPHDPMAIPHAHHVLPSSPAPAPAKVVTPSALLAEKLAAAPSGKPVKRKYAYQRNRR